MRVASSPLFRGLGVVTTLVGAAQNEDTAWDDSRGEDVEGRSFTMLAAGGSSFLIYRFPVLAGANTLDGGSLGADFGAVGTVTGSAVSGGLRGAGQAFDQDVRDRDDHDYLGLAANVTAGATEGVVHGASEGLNTFAADAADGKYGAFVKGVSNVENDLIAKLW